MIFTSYTSPVKKVTGKNAYLDATKRFYLSIVSMEVRDIMIDDEKALALTHYELKHPDGNIFSSDVAEIFTVKNGKINTFEIYFDSAPFPKYYYQAMQIEKKYFLLKLLPPRPTFFSDITDDERNIMNEHGKYWRNLMEQGIVHVFGPVLDPKGVWGLGIVEAINQDDIRSFTANDPAIKSGLTTLEIYPIQAVLRK